MYIIIVSGSDGPCGVGLTTQLVTAKGIDLSTVVCQQSTLYVSNIIHLTVDRLVHCGTLNLSTGEMY